MTRTLQITRPDDWHLHLRDGDALPVTVNATARVFQRAIVMPNLKPPVVTVSDAAAYRSRILAALNPEVAVAGFDPLMTLYLTDSTSADEIRRAADSDFVHAVKLYPAGATTNSDAGVTAMSRVSGALEAMQETGLPLLVHGEVTTSDIDIFDREKRFIDDVMTPLMADFPELKIVFEHITTADAAAFVEAGPDRLGATITPHHLMFNRNDMLVGGIRPHFYCLPILKRNTHQQALIRAATGTNPRFFLGTDSAPHARHTKENGCGCAGVYSAHAALEFYAAIFDAENALDRLEAFASFNGADFYGLPRNGDTVTLVAEPQEIPAKIGYAEHELVPMAAGETLGWQLAGATA